MALPQRKVTEEGHEYQLGVNHLAHFLLANLLLDDLVAAGAADDPGRVVVLSSSAHTIPSALQSGDLSALQQEDYSAWGAYGQSKFANLLFAYELDRRCRERGLPIVANAVHPGIVNTELFDGDGALKGPLRGLVNGALSFAAKTPEEGARTSVLLATAPEGKLSGRYWQNEKPAPSVDVDLAGQLPLPKALKALLPSAVKRRTSYDPATWSELWRESERLTGLRVEEVAAWAAASS
uniref:Protochlorophyllide reductase n=1 Tax=Alexandrium catenella TaxID=2925 RepID=A0A7S1QZL7_ALECA